MAAPTPDDTFLLRGSDGEEIAGDLYLPQAELSPLVIVVHGFKGFKHWGFFPTLGRFLADSGRVSTILTLSPIFAPRSSCAMNFLRFLTYFR